jgi:hypothetical protein
MEDFRGSSPNKRKTGGVRSNGEYLLDLENMRANIEQSTRLIADLKVEIEAGRKNFHGSIPSEDLKT